MGCSRRFSSSVSCMCWSDAPASSRGRRTAAGGHAGRQRRLADLYRLPAPPGQRAAPPAGAAPAAARAAFRVLAELLANAHRRRRDYALAVRTLGRAQRLLTIDLGEVRTVGSVVNNLGRLHGCIPARSLSRRPTDGVMWSLAWSGSVRRASDSRRHGRSETPAHRPRVSATPGPLHPACAPSTGAQRCAVGDRRARGVVVLR